MLNNSGSYITMPIYCLRALTLYSLISMPSISNYPPLTSYILKSRLAIVLLPHPEWPTSAIFLVAVIFMSIFFKTFSVLDGYLNSTYFNSISPYFIIFSPSVALVSIFDLSSMMSKTLAAATLALLTDGA